MEFSDKNRTIYKVRQIMIICQKKLKKVYHFKMAAILLIFLPCDYAIPRKIEKITFNELWLKVADHQ